MAKEYQISIRLKAIVEDVARKFKQVTASLRDVGKATQETASGMDKSSQAWLHAIQQWESESQKAASGVQQSFGLMQKAGEFLKGSLMGVFKGLAVAAAAYLGLMAKRGIEEMSRMAAANLDVAKGFDNLAARAGLVSNEVVRALKEASKGTVDEYNLMLQANKALRLGVATTVEEFEQLMKVAYVRAKEFGISVAEAWEYIVVGIGRASPMILDNIGVLLDATRVYEDYAQTIGKSADELTKLEEKEAIRNAILREGAPDLEKWNEMGVTASDVFGQYDATMAELRQELGELFLPAVIEVTQALSDLAQLVQGEVVPSHQAQRDAVLDTARSYDELYDRMARVFELQQSGGRWMQEGTGYLRELNVEEQAAIAVNEALKASYADIDIKMHDAANTVRDFGNAQDDTAQSTEAAAQRTENAKAAWMDYLNSVAAANQQFANQVAAAQFRAAQAAAQAAFRLQQIEASYQQQRAQAIASAGASIASAVASADDRIRQIRRELLDDLADMEWEYQRQRTEAVKEAPWWIRQALASEYAERERIRQSGDAEELAAFDKNLREKIRAIDPVYAEELDKMDEQYQHKRDITRRDARQAMDDARDAVANQTAALEAGLANQLAAIEANYQRQKEAWEFQNAQRLEAEKFAMSQIQTTHAQKMEDIKGDYIEKMKALNVELAQKLIEQKGEWDRHGVGVKEGVRRAGRKIREENNKHLRKMRTDVGDRLEEIEPKFEHWGSKHWRAYRRSWINAMRNNPLPSPPEPGAGGGEGGGGNGNDFQHGAWQIPRDMWAMLHRGEMVVPAPAAERIRRGEGGVTIIIENLTLAGAISPMNAAMFADELGEQLGRRMLQRGV